MESRSATGGRPTSSPRGTLLFLGLLALCALLNLPTLGLFPGVWMDEVHQIEYGRLVLEPGSDWSAVWHPLTDAPVMAWSYLGPLLQELVYRGTGGWELAARASGLVGTIVAAVALRAWLLARGTRPGVAGLMGVLLLLDPIVVQSFRGGRADGWAVACGLAACWLLRRGGGRHAASAAGAMTALGMVVWQSVAILLPLVVLELVQSAGSRRVARRQLAAFLAVGAVTGVLLLAFSPGPFLPVGGAADPLLRANVPLGADPAPWIAQALDPRYLAQSLQLTPVLLATAALGAALRPSAALIAVTLVAVLMVTASMPYMFRGLYLLPYLLLHTVRLLGPGTGRLPRRLRPLKAVPPAVLLAWAFGMSIIAQPLHLIDTRGWRDRSFLEHVAVSAVGPGDDFVYVGTFNLYFEGRKLGWRILTPFVTPGPVPDPGLLERSNVAILRERDLGPETLGHLAGAGFHRGETYRHPAAPELARSRLSDSERGNPYGPYVVFRRASAAGSVGGNAGSRTTPRTGPRGVPQ